MRTRFSCRDSNFSALGRAILGVQRMADNDTDLDEEFLPKPPTPLLVKLTFLLVVINLGGTGYAAFRKPEPVIVQAAPAPPPMNEPGPMADLDPFIVNLNEPESPRYLKTKFAVELKNEDSKALFERSKPAIRDGVLRYLSSLTVADTLGADSKRNIREAVLAVVREQMGDKDQVRGVYFSEFVVQ